MDIKKIAIFDIDGTIFETNGSNFIMQALKSKNKTVRKVGFFQLIMIPISLFFYVFVNMSLAVKMLIYCLNGCSEHDYKKCMAKFHPVKIKSICQILEKHQQNKNTLVVTITASPKICLSKQICNLGIPLDNQYGAIPEKDEMGIYTGNSLKLVNGHTKKEIAKNLARKYNVKNRTFIFTLIHSRFTFINLGW